MVQEGVLYDEAFQSLKDPSLGYTSLLRNVLQIFPIPSRVSLPSLSFTSRDEDIELAQTKDSYALLFSFPLNRKKGHAKLLVRPRCVMMK